MKKTLCFIICLAVVAAMTSMVLVSAKNNPVTVELDGTTLEFDVNPEIINGRTMVPLRKIFEEIGAFVKWDNDTQTVSARKNSKTIFFSINSTELKIDKGDIDSSGNPVYKTVILDTPAKIVSGRTLVPARAISESFDLNVEWDEQKQKVTITSNNKEDDSWKSNVGTINLTDLTFNGNGIEIDGNQINITSGGDFTLTGTLKDGNITVSTNEKVKLRLNNASITSNDNPCIFFKKADKAYITLSDGSINTLVAKNCNNGAIYSKENLEIKGGGTVNIDCLSDHAIKASDNLTIENGTLNLNAAGDGIHINDTFKMTGGTVNITSVNDGIDCESIVNISGGTINIETNGTPIENTQTTTETTEEAPRRGMWEMDEADVEFEKSTKGINAEWMMVISGGEINVNSASHAIHCQDEIEITGGKFSLSSKYDKGISAHGNLTVSGADTVIDVAKSTEGIESNNVMTINDGVISVVSTDDAINATGGNSGTMHGLGKGGNREDFKPGQNVGGSVINSDALGTQRPNNKENRPWRNQNDKMPVTSDGHFTEKNILPPKEQFIPVTPDEEFPNMNMPPKPPMNDNNKMPGNTGAMGRNMKNCLIINGGELELYAGDDCLDANGNLIINAGLIKAIKSKGTFFGANSIIDPDGQMIISDRAQLILAAGQGNERNLKITQNYITLYCDSTHSAGDLITLKDSSDNIIYTYNPKGEFSSVLIASKFIETGKTYTITVGKETYNAQISQQNTVIGIEKMPSFGRK